MADDEVFRVRGRAVVAVLVAVALGLGVLAALLQASNLHGALTAFDRADKRWFAGLLAGQLIAYGGYAWGYRTMARACGGPLFTFWTTLRLSIVSFGAYVIASSAGGLGVDFWALHHAGEGPHRAARRVLAFNILEWAVLGSLAAIAAAASLAVGGGGAPLAMALAWLVLVPSCVVAALWVSGRRHASEESRRHDRGHHQPVVALLDRDDLVAAPEAPVPRLPEAVLQDVAVPLEPGVEPLQHQEERLRQ